MTPAVLVTPVEPGIAAVTLFNPEKLNALTAAMWAGLEQVMTALSADASLRCVVIRGEGQAFAAGGDIGEFDTLRATHDQAAIYHGQVARALAAISDGAHPVVASIEGPCIGGGLEIAAACDLRIAGEGATFGAPIKKLGFSMAHGELAGLLALAGPAVAAEILLEGRILKAREACDKGLLTRVVADGEVAAEALATARRIAEGAPLAARMHRKLIRRLTAAAATMSEQEVRESFGFLDSEDYREGLNAFREKRKPVFRGR